MLPQAVEEVDAVRRPNLMEVGELEGNTGLQGVLSQLFSVLLPEIEGLITFGERMDS